MRDAFFHLNFLNAVGILAQKVYKVCTIFVNFLTLKMEDDSNSQASLVIWLQVRTGALELTVLSKTNFIFQWISSSNATLLSVVFFSSSVHKLNYIKNAFV